MTMDVVEYLRKRATMRGSASAGMLTAAADEIDALRDRVAELEKNLLSAADILGEEGYTRVAARFRATVEKP